MGTVVSLDEFRKNLSDIVARVMYGNQTVVVQRHNKTGVIVISEKEYESLKDPRKRLSKTESTKNLLDLAGIIPKGSGLPSDLSEKHNEYAWD